MESFSAFSAFNFLKNHIKESGDIVELLDGKWSPKQVMHVTQGNIHSIGTNTPPTFSLIPLGVF